MQITVSLRDDVLKRFGNRLASLGDEGARKVMSRALNHEGDKGRTQIKRVLVRQTGIKYGQVNKAMKTIRSSPATLTYTLEARGDETNISLFGARQRKKGVSAAPWGTRRIFKHSFVVPSYDGRVYVRRGASRFPLKALYGPNIARELLKDESRAAFLAGSANIADRVAHEIDHFLRGG